MRTVYLFIGGESAGTTRKVNAVIFHGPYYPNLPGDLSGRPAGADGRDE